MSDGPLARRERAGERAARAATPSSSRWWWISLTA